MKRIAAEALADEIDRIRRAGTGNPISNYFFGSLSSRDIPCWTSPTCLLFLDCEHQFHRVYFLARDIGELARLLGFIDERPLVVDYVTKSAQHEPVERALLAAGFHKLAVYQRMTHPDHATRHRAAADPARIDRARREEVDEFFDRLCRDFDVRMDRIPSREEFRSIVGSGQALVHRGPSGGIDAYAIYQLHGRRAHLKYWYSRPGNHPAIAVKLLSDFFTDMAARNIATSFLWVQTTKTAEIRVYENLGYCRDGLLTHVYAKE